MTRAIEDLGFDSVWVGEHLLYRWEDRPAARAVGGLDAAGRDRRVDVRGSSSGRSSPARTSTTPRCWPSRPRRSTRSAAAASSSVSVPAGTRPSSGPSAIPYDHRIDRFEEAFTIIRTLLREGAIDFDGRWYQARDCELLPRGPRPAGPPLMIGSNGPRMLRDRRCPTPTPGTRWYADIGNTPAGVAPLRAVVDEACRDVGRDPADVERTVAVLVRLPGGTGRVSGDASRAAIPPLTGDPAAHGRGAPRLRPRRDRARSSSSSTRSPCRRSRRSRRPWWSSIAADRRRWRYRDLRTGGSVRTRC